MNKVHILLTLVAFMAYMIMSGLLTQTGIILDAVAEQIDLPNDQAVSVFSWLTGGNLIGTLISMYLFMRFQLKNILLIVYSALVLIIFILTLLELSEFIYLAGILFLLGICCGCGLSGGAIILSKLYSERRRASAFIATDCAFSAAGYIFPTLASFILLSKMDWRLSYAAVSSLSVLILLILIFNKNWAKLHLEKQQFQVSVISELKRIATMRVMCFAIGVAFYLIAQTTFLIWAPSYLIEYLGAAPEDANKIVGNYWGFSVFGLVLAAVLVNVIPPRLMLLVVASIALIASISFTMMESIGTFLLLGTAFGFLTTCTYKTAISIGSQQVNDCPPILVTLMLFSGSIGSTLAPYLSGRIVARFDERGALMMTVICFALMLLLFVLALFRERQANKNIAALHR